MPRFHRLVPFIFLAFAACGQTMQPGDDDGVTPDAGDKGTTDGGPPPPSCDVGTACDFDGSAGVCEGTSCGSCSDDAQCQSAYGATFACVDGECVVPPPPAGCTDDSQCDTGEVCNQAGACVTQSGCSVHGDIECCSASDCGSGQSCQAHQCVATNSGCTAPTTATYTVDPSYVGPSTGSQACPFKTLHGAFNEIRNDSFTADSTVRIVSGALINATSEGGADKFPLSVPGSTYIHTVDNAAADAVVVAPPNTTAFVVQYAVQPNATATYNVRISHLEIKQAAAGTAGTAVDASAGSSATPVHLDHLNIHNFFNGIHVEGGYTAIFWGVNSHDNANAGLYVGGGRADITVAADADARTHFDRNGNGIWVTEDASSVLDASGAIGATDQLETITASSNAGQGVHLASPAAANSVSHVGIVSNGGSGLVLFGGAKVKARFLNIDMSGASGIKILDNGSATSLAGIDLGKSGDLGKNHIQNSVDSHVCVATTYDSTSFPAMGNIYGQKDCSVSGTTAKVNMWLTCAGHGEGFNDPAPAIREQVDYCGITVHP